MKKNTSGFTVVELVTVIILLGIISAIALPRFFNNQTFTSFFDKTEFESALSWTRNRAITSQCAHEFRITNTGWMVLRDDDLNAATTNDCESLSLGDNCTGTEFFSFIYQTNSNIVRDSSNTPLTGDEITSSTTRRLIFTGNGKLYLLSNLPSPLAEGCTSLDGLSVFNSDGNLTGESDQISLDLIQLSADGETAYVDVQ